MKEKRNKARRGVLALMLCMTLVWSACSTDWIHEAEQIVAALVPAAANLVTLVAALQGKSVSSGDLQLVQNTGAQAAADLQLIESLIAAYQKADASSKPAILNQIQNAIAGVQANLQGLLPALHIKDTATQTKITAVVGIVLSEVQSLAAVVPLVQGSGPSGQGSGTVAALRAADSRGRLSLHVPLSASEFVKSYNATLTAKTGNAELDGVTAGIQIHLHGKVERWASGGVLK
jgi:hypothetical protein